MIGIYIIIGWIICGVLFYGLNFGYFQNGYPLCAEDDYKKDMKEAVVISFLGPIALFSMVVFMITNRKYYGFKWK